MIFLYLCFWEKAIGVSRSSHKDWQANVTMLIFPTYKEHLLPQIKMTATTAATEAWWTFAFNSSENARMNNYGRKSRRVFCVLDNQSFPIVPFPCAAVWTVTLDSNCVDYIGMKTLFFERKSREDGTTNEVKLSTWKVKRSRGFLVKSERKRKKFPKFRKIQLSSDTNRDLWRYKRRRPSHLVATVKNVRMRLVREMAAPTRVMSSNAVRSPCDRLWWRAWHVKM